MTNTLRGLVAALVVLQMVLSPMLPALAEDAPVVEAVPVEAVVAPEEPTPSVSTETVLETPVEPAAPTPEESVVEPRPETLPEPSLAVPSEDSAQVAPEVRADSATTSESHEVVEAPAQEVQKQEEKPVAAVGYSTLMREWKEAKVNGRKAEVRGKLAAFVEAEKERLRTLGVSSDRQAAYLERLEKQFAEEGGEPEKKVGLLGRVWALFSGEEAAPAEESDEVKIPEHPGQFRFNDPTIEVKSVQTASKKMEEKLEVKESPLSTLFSVEEVLAGPLTLPTLYDVQSDESQVVLSQEMRTIAAQLHNNPVEIYNYVRAHVTYEPYYGAKKGAAGCMREKRCNDIDASSFMIALMRAAGIPARYVRGVAVMPVETVKELVGVDEVKTAYGALYVSRVPVYLVSGNNVGANYDQADFSQEHYFGLEWTAVEIFYDYDERGGNIPNELSFINATSTEAVRVALQDVREKQWIPLDPVVQKYTRTRNEIVADTAQFNGQTFWNNYLQYQGTLSPVEKYVDDFKAATGKDVKTAQYQSGTAAQPKSVSILPPTLPYELSAGQRADGSTIEIRRSGEPSEDTMWTIQMVINRASDNLEVLEGDMPTSLMLNKPFTLSYRGATEADRQVIESYGGIAYTPAELAQVMAVLDDGQNEAEYETPVSIGDQLVWTFNYFLGDTQVWQDQKFSVAGNEEGLYIVGSVVLSDPGITTPEEALFAGNASIAREYLKKTAENREVLANSLDRQIGTEFIRAVVTQNRVLSRVNGTPTTFDFKGLTIDASAYTSDFSRRGNYKDRRQEYRLLYGLDASYYEGQIFGDLAGLESISTVKGIQYAHANPNEYTIHVIDSSNEQVIDTLNLSANTKANMHADVQKGNVVTTPDKPITKGAFTGIIYTSIAPDYTGTYAIGEQVQQNGGFTTNGYVEWVVTIDGVDYRYFKNEGNNTVFVFADGVGATAKTCQISKATFLNIMNGDFGWEQEYGLPCLVGTKTFGGKIHTYILTTDAAKFSSFGKYDYWIKERNAKIVLKNDLNRDNFSHLVRPELYNDKFKFNITAGTYSQTGGHDGPYEVSGDCKKCLTIYYSPNSAGGYGWAVHGYVLDKLAVNDNRALNVLGFPVSGRGAAAESFAGTNGYYQNFLGGQVYIRDGWFSDDTYYVPAQIADYYNGPSGEKDGKFGTGGKFGFPTGDPIYVEVSGEILQDFEAKQIQYLKQNNQINLVEYNDESRRASNKAFGERMLQKVISGEITDVEAFAYIADYLSYVNDKTYDFAKDMVALFTGSSGLVKSELMKVINKTTSYDGDEAPLRRFRVLGFSDTGFRFSYNDSHYCMDKSTAGNYRCISNQLYHSMGGFGLAFFHDYALGVLGTIYHDVGVNPLGVGGGSTEDTDLGYLMSSLGSALSVGSVQRAGVGKWILENVAVNKDMSNDQFDYLRLPQSEIIRRAEFRKKFRIFEYEQNGNIDGRWDYSQDMLMYQCNGSELYYQDYNYFYRNGQNQGKTRLVWNSSIKKMIVLSGNQQTEYLNIAKICSNLTSLTNTYGVGLTKSFEDMVNELE